MSNGHEIYSVATTTPLNPAWFLLKMTSADPALLWFWFT
jgi:hypothetical protein